MTTTNAAQNAVNIFVSIDVLGLLGDTDYPGLSGQTIDEAIREYYIAQLDGSQYADIHQTLELARNYPLQSWNESKQLYEFNALWNFILSYANTHSIGPKRFASTSGTEEVLGNYVRLIANRNDTKGWKLAVDASDLEDGYLTQAYNLAVKAWPGQWLRWWGNSVSPYSAIQCVVGLITGEGRPWALPQLQEQHGDSVSYNFPSGLKNDTTYSVETNSAYSWMGQLKPDTPITDQQTGANLINYDIKFNLVDPDGDIFAVFQIDPSIIVIEEPTR